METLFLSIVLLGLVAALQAQDPLSFPSEELNVRLGGPVGRDGKCPDPCQWAAPGACGSGH